ncbi:hypothetical protein AMATHDRAFT_71683 [Amanita thiersii Skay4041]|uniref:Uncharacterized protein n=1 Tax=Amanita thiersii Skay4041 TaxID=703135 RepID=A0A2A9N6B9_9AGAR|nr:hypothetical protein AMATHDRAFT_71683 [Amanita thiersii Skay4041]
MHDFSVDGRWSRVLIREGDENEIDVYIAAHHPSLFKLPSPSCPVPMSACLVVPGLLNSAGINEMVQGCSKRQVMGSKGVDPLRPLV